MTTSNANVCVAVDPTNPGQFFACCGLLELADRLWPAAEGWFGPQGFCIRAEVSKEPQPGLRLMNQLAKSVLTNTMSLDHVERLTKLSRMKAADRAKTRGLDDEKKALEKMRREEPILLKSPFNIRIDWFQDTRSGGSRLKTWAGQQSVLDIATSMKTPLEDANWLSKDPGQWLTHAVSGCGLPFNFDSDLGGQGSALDVGFSFDPLASSAATKIESTARPCLELLAFIGLQRFRPRQVGRENRFLYRTWNLPLAVEIAAPAACGFIPLFDAPSFEFRLLYRTKYLKSFLPAVPFTGGFNDRVGQV